MELWKQIEIFNKKKQNWLFKSDNIEERLDALSKILEFGYPYSDKETRKTIHIGNLIVRNISDQSKIRAISLNPIDRNSKILPISFNPLFVDRDSQISFLKRF